MEIDLSSVIEDSNEEVIAYPDNDFKFLNELDIDQDVKRRLSIHLKGIIKGNSDVYTTPLVKRISPEAILSRWDEIFEENKSAMNQNLIELESLNRSKFGPRSIAQPWSKRSSSLEDYFKVERKSSNLSISSSWFETANLRPLSNEKAMAKLKNKTNSGLPFYTKKDKVKQRTLREFNVLKYRKDPCILFTRTQEGNKTRNVWGFPMIDTLIESCYYFVLLEYMRLKPWRAALKGPDQVDKSITALIDKAMSNNQALISIDFSSYDSSVSPSLTRHAFNYIKSLFQQTYHDTIDMMCKRFYTIGIVTPDGVKKGEHGVPSGSTFTNEIDSIVQYLVAKSTRLVSDSETQIQGDDGVYAVSLQDTEDFIKAFEAEGLNVNKDKSYIMKDSVVFLQNLYHPDYRQKSGIIGGVYPTYRALNRLIYQERWSNFEDFGLEGRDYYSLRAISILENCKHHPLFDKLVEFIWSIDKYSLGYTREGVNKYKEMVINGSGSGGLINNQYGDDIKGLKSFATVKLLSKLS